MRYLKIYLSFNCLKPGTSDCTVLHTQAPLSQIVFSNNSLTSFKLSFTLHKRMYSVSCVSSICTKKHLVYLLRFSFFHTRLQSHKNLHILCRAIRTQLLFKTWYLNVPRASHCHFREEIRSA